MHQLDYRKEEATDPDMIAPSNWDELTPRQQVTRLVITGTIGVSMIAFMVWSVATHKPWCGFFLS
jgi:hypothetical protein